MNFKDKITVSDELQIKCAYNPTNMVLDALDDVFVAKAMVDETESHLV